MKGKSQFRKEHVHFKPENYIGSFAQVQERIWIIENGKPTLKAISYVPAVLKLCEELLINAIQQKIREPSVAHIQIFAKQNGVISVINEGAITFDELNPSASELQTVFGEEDIGSQLYRRGRGGKLVNMFSRTFFVQTGSKQRGQAIKVQWRDNMAVMEAPRTTVYDKRSYTKVQAALDMQRFRLAKFSADFIGMLERRAWDIAALHNMNVIFNERPIQFANLSEYAKMFTKGGALFSEQEGAGWRVLLGPSEHGYQQLSFVNSCFWTRNGGTHVNSVICQIASKALQRLHKRLKDPNEVMQSPNRFTSNYFLFVNVTLQFPQFNSVTRESLVTKIISPFRISEAAMKFLQANQALKTYTEMTRQRQQNKIRQSPKIDAVSLPRLEDAGKAGISSRCTLVLVENDATRQLMAAGLQCVSREYFGIYTLRGKPPNAREIKNPIQHSDFAAILKALGLPTSAQQVQELRYSSVLIVADQDYQGVSIKGLLLNFFEAVLPWALRTRGFIKLLVPPVVRCVNAVGNVRQFLSDRDYRSWSSLNSVNEWTPTYFRSIGSMDPLHMRDLFAERKKYSFSITYQTPLDDVALSLPYGSDAEARRKWLQDHRPESILDYNMNSKTVSLRQFVDRELCHVFYLQATRNLPCVIDGLTTTQRKVLYCLMRTSEGQEIKVDRLVGQVLQHCAFEEAESVRKSILTLGRNYVGSNNLALIEAIGQFGTRMASGKDHAPSRHLCTSLPSYVRFLFNAEDQELLLYPVQEAQPSYYVPILPLILINGFTQTGPLWKSTVLPHKIADIIEAIKERLGKNPGKVSLLPGWEGYKGSVQQQRNLYTVEGSYELRCTRTIIIKEIPPFQSLLEYRTMLQCKDEVDDVKEEQKGDSYYLIVRFKESRVPKDLQHYLQISMNLQDTPSILISSSAKPKKYHSLGDILEEYLQARLKLYEKRKQAIISKLTRAIELANQKIRFVRDVLAGEFELTDSEDAWRLKFIRKGYKRYQDLQKIQTRNAAQTYREFEHLQKMPMNEISERRVTQLRAERTECEEKLAQLKRTTEKQMWLRDLSQFEERWRKVMRQRQQITLDSLRRAENFYKQEPSEPSLNNRNQKQQIQFDEISLDSKAREQLERSKTQGISEEEPPTSKIKQNGISKARSGQPKKINNKIGELQAQMSKADLARAEFQAQRKNFEIQLKEMERKNNEFQEKMRREADLAKREADRARKQEMLEKQRNRENQKLKREEQQQQRLKEIRQKQKEKLAKDKANVQREALNRRQALGRHAMEIGKKVEEDQRREKEEREKSEKSNRNHLPTSSGIMPKITVPYPCDSSTFQVTHVQRKRFSSKDSKIDQAHINRIHEEIRRQNEQDEERANRNNMNQCIDLDDD